MVSKSALKDEQYVNSGNLEARIALHNRFTPPGADLKDFLWDRYEFQPTDRILEIGGGTGAFWLHPTASRHGASLHLTDFSPGMLATAQTNLAGLPAITFAEADAEHLPFADSSYSCILAQSMLYHVPDKHRALSEMKRVLTPGGWVGLVLNRVDNMRRIFEAMAEIEPTAKPPASDAAIFHTAAAKPAIEAVFARVQAHDYECVMQATDPDLVVGWAQSSYVVQPLALDTAFWRRYRNLIQDEIDRVGHFAITKAATLFIARP